MDCTFATKWLIGLWWWPLFAVSPIDLFHNPILLKEIAVQKLYFVVNKTNAKRCERG
jgi:hypothetical protein